MNVVSLVDIVEKTVEGAMSIGIFIDLSCGLIRGISYFFFLTLLCCVSGRNKEFIDYNRASSS